MWTIESRARHDGSKLRYTSDVSEEEWSWIAPLIPPAKRGGLPRQHSNRDLINGLVYLLSTGCRWRYIPKDLPRSSTLHDYLTRWNYDGTIERINHALYLACR
jgi:transposase